MTINQHALDAIRQSQITGPNLANLFEKMTSGTQAVGSSGGLLVLDYINRDQLPEEGELVPILTLSLKPFTLQRPPQK